jgi:CBS domain-containing protein
MATQKIREIMTQNPKTCMDNHTVDCTLQIMKNENCGLVPVVDEDRKILGVVTDRDIAMCLLEHPDTPLNRLRVADCQCYQDQVDQVITLKPDEDIQRAVTLMEKYQVRRLPVVDNENRVIGIVAQADIARKDRNREEVAEMLGRVSI